MRQLFALILLIAFTPLAFATSALGKHTLAVAQSMSAFYMVSLSDGDNRYEKEFQTYADQAQSQLDAIKDPVVAKELNEDWFRLRRQLQYDYVGGMGLSIPSSVRLQYRDYLSKAYQNWLSQLEQEPSPKRRIEIVHIKSEVISARYFDVASAIQSKEDEKGLAELNPTSDANGVKTELGRLARIQNYVDKKSIRNVEKKWAFMQKALAIYREPGAYFLLYYNKGQIEKHLSIKGV